MRNAVPEITGIRQIYCRSLAVTCKPDDQCWLHLTGCWLKSPRAKSWGVRVPFLANGIGVAGWCQPRKLPGCLIALFIARRNWDARRTLTTYIVRSHDPWHWWPVAVCLSRFRCRLSRMMWALSRLNIISQRNRYVSIQCGVDCT